MCSFLSAALAALTALGAAEGLVPNRAPVRIEREGHVLLTATDRRVRALAADVEMILARGMARSTTFGRLMTDIDNTDVIVYVEFSSKLRQTVAGRLLFAGTTREGTRYLRVQLSPDMTISQHVAVLAHELQHALEVARAPEVRDQTSFARLYDRIGSGKNEELYYETKAAREIGRRVLIEVQQP